MFDAFKVEAPIGLAASVVLLGQIEIPSHVERVDLKFHIVLAIVVWVDEDLEIIVFAND